MENKPRISIVTGTYNRVDSLRDMMRSVDADLFPFKIPYEFVIVDGGSTDGTLEWLRGHHRVNLIEQGELRGAIDAFTTGARAAQGKYVLLANDDVTFHEGSILRAIVHLEEHMGCGAVAFADNRYQEYKKHLYEVDYMQSSNTHPANFVPYAQVGLFRRWLGDESNWWGLGEINARTYGGDNFLSCRIWEKGYTVDPVEGCLVTDHHEDIQDELREINSAAADTGWREMFPEGAFVSPVITSEQQDAQEARIVYLPIYERGHVAQHEQKRGLRDALNEAGWCAEIDYVELQEEAEGELSRLLSVFKPHLVVTQFHGKDAITSALAHQIRKAYTPIWVNWNGDVWEHGLTSPETLELLKFCDLQTVVNPNVLPFYKERGVVAAYWQIGYEESGENLPAAPACDVVFLGNNNSAHSARYEMVKAAIETGAKVHLWGDGWEEFGPAAQGNCLYDFRQGAAIMRNAKIVLGDNSFPEQYGFVSNRIFQALAAEGALLIHGRVKGLEEITGLVPGAHYEEFHDLPTLQALIMYYMNPDNDPARRQIVRQGAEHVRLFHSFKARVEELFKLIDEHSVRQVGNTITVENPNGRTEGGVVGRITGEKYHYKPGEPLIMEARDALALIKERHNQGWRQVKNEQS